MICEVRENEVILSKPTIGDILCLILIMIRKNRVLAFTKPKEE